MTPEEARQVIEARYKAGEREIRVSVDVFRLYDDCLIDKRGGLIQYRPEPYLYYKTAKVYADL